MNWQHLIYFSAAAKHKSFRKAAQELFVDSSTISKAISGIENELGVNLLHREGRNITLSKYGKIFLNYVTSASMEIDKGIHELQELSDAQHGCLNIASIFSVASSYIPQTLSMFFNHSPNIKVHFTQGTTKNIVEDVLSGEVDVGFVGDFDYNSLSKSLNRELLYNEEIVLLVPNNHPLARHHSVSFSDIKHELFVGYNDKTGLNPNVDKAVRIANGGPFTFNTRYSVNEDNTVVGMVRANHGIAFVSKFANLNYDGLKLLTLDDLYIVRNIYMIYRNNEYIPNVLRTFSHFVLKENDFIMDTIRSV